MGVVILGGGLAGLSCGWRLLQRGVGVSVHERDAGPGGKASSTTEAGFTFDRTGHWLHLRDDAVRAFVLDLLDGRVLEVERQARIHSHGVLTRYPFQANTYGLPPAVVRECVDGFRSAHAAALSGDAPAPRHLDEAFERWFGPGITRHFMRPYNEKMWGVPLTEITPAWCSRFVPRPSLREVEAGATEEGARGLGYNPRFLYPADGGVGLLAERLGARLGGALRTGEEATEIRWRDRRVAFADGGERPYDRLISTLPLPDLVGRLRPSPPSEVTGAAERLRATSVSYVDYGVRGDVNRGHHWIYFPEPGVPFHRVGSYSNAAPHLAPAGHGSLYVEVSAGPDGGPPEWPSLLPRIRRALVEHGLIEGEDAIVLERPRHIRGAYVLFDHAHADCRRTVLRWLEDDAEVECIGRYARWTYSSMEDAMVDGWRAGDR